MTQNAGAFLAALGKDDEEDGPPRKRRTKKADAEAAPAPVEGAAPDNLPDPFAQDPAPATAPEPTPEQRRNQIEDVPIPGTPDPTPTRRPRPEPVHKTSVDLLYTLKQGLQELCDRDHRGPKAELTDAVRAHLLARGIEIEEWKG